VIGNMNYEGGCNPINIPYITGLGWQRWREIVHQYAQNDYQALPPSGFPLGNIQGGFGWLDFYGLELGLLCFPPDSASSGQYPFYDRWGDSFNVTTEFVVVDLARSLASYASLMARTGVAGAPYARTATSISGLPASIPVERSITTTFHAPGADLTGARIVWEARNQEPSIGPSFTFSAKDPGAQWVEAEALLPDGRRLFCRTNFTATFSTSIPPNRYQSAPLTPTPEFAALYHVDGTLTDATGKNAALRLAGNARMDQSNVGWMAVRAGRALRFDDLGDTATVTIPPRFLYTNGTSEITLEAMVFVEQHKAWNRTSVNMLSLEGAWNVSIKWFEDIYTGPHAGGGTMLDVSGAALAGAMPLAQWHHLSISIFPGSYAVRVNGATVKVVSGSELAAWNGASPVLELGNFSGWIDEIAIRSRVGGAPAPVANLVATAISPTQIALTWVDLSTNEHGFRIYRSTDNLNFTEVAEVSANVTGWTQNSLQPNTRYYFAVSSFNAHGESLEVVATETTTGSLPGLPTGLTASAQGGGIRLNWNAVTGATSYEIKRSTFPVGNWQTLISGVTTTSYLDAGVPSGVAHYYSVVAVNSIGESASSASVYATVPSPTANVRFLGVNTSRKGNWIGTIGWDGYILAGDAEVVPEYANVSLSNQLEWLSNSPSNDPRALQNPAGMGRIVSWWYSATSFDVDIRFTDGQFHKVAMYTVDWEKTRDQRMDVIDAATGRILHSSSFGGASIGAYVEYSVQGHVKIRYTRVKGPNAVLAGVFFDPAP